MTIDRSTLADLAESARRCAMQPDCDAFERHLIKRLALYAETLEALLWAKEEEGREEHERDD